MNAGMFVKLKSLYTFIFILFSLISLSSNFPHDSLEKRSISSNNSVKSPVILIPGDGGCQLEAKLNKPQIVHYFCDKKSSDYFSIWLNLELLVPYVLDCWVDNMRLVYNNQTRTTSNSPGVDIRVPGFGTTFPVEWLDPSKIFVGSYFNPIVVGLEIVGYESNINIKGAPYDFRKAPNELGDFYANYRQLIASTHESTNQKVTIVCHSLGCVTTLYFLNQQSQQWKDQHIKSLISLGAPWAGAVKAIKAIASGDNLGAFVISSLTVRPEQRTFPSLMFLMPSPKFWGPDEILVTIPGKNYTVKDYEQFFNDINHPDGWNMRLDTQNLIFDLKPPGVEVHCLYGFNVTTASRLDYVKFPDTQPNLIFGDGDGTVNLRSLNACATWQGKQKQPIHIQTYKGVDHMQILAHNPTIDYIKNVVSQ